MKIDNLLTDDVVLHEIGERISNHRLNKNMTQAQLADSAGVSLSTVIRMEGGSSSQISNLVRVLRALGLLDNMELLVPKPTISPIQQLEMEGKRRQRARPKTTDKPQRNPAPVDQTLKARAGGSSMERFMEGFQNERLARLQDMMSKSYGLAEQANTAVTRLDELKTSIAQLDDKQLHKIIKSQDQLDSALTEQERLTKTFQEYESKNENLFEAMETPGLAIEKLAAIQNQITRDIKHINSLASQLDTTEQDN